MNLESGTMATKKSFFISDLHLFSRRSSAPKWESAFRSSVQQAHTFVLGGDIFDFRWSTQATLDHAIEDSIDWLKRLLDLNPSCNFHYLLGNHDCHPAFVEALQKLADSTAHMVWHRHFLRLDDCVFLHGDIVDARVRIGEDCDEVLDAKRLAGELRDPPNALSHALYDVAVRARVHRLVVQLAKPNEMVLRRLVRYLDKHDLSSATGVNRVYFGHTHRPVNAVLYSGMRFYNPGATIKGLPFNVIETETPPLSISQWK